MHSRARLLTCVVVVALWSVSGCRGERAQSSAPSDGARGAAAARTGTAATGQGTPAPVAAGTAPVAADGQDTAAAASNASAAGEATPARDPAPGRDFIEEARMLYRVVACAGDAPVPDHLDAGVVAAHCKRLEPRKARYRERYATRAKEFIAGLRPEELPSTVVYPFGGGDLISALVAYPEAREITTMSLEHAGDPRRIRDIGAGDLRDSLETFRAEFSGMLMVSNNTSVNLSSAHSNLLPAQLSAFLVGLAVHDLVPVSVRYFTLEPDGSPRYLDDEAIQAMQDDPANRLKYDWQKPNFSAAFSHVEIQFRARDAGPDAPVRVHRHIAANLANAQLAEDGPLLAHLRAKGRIAAMTKAASYLLWRGDFSRIRDYLLTHMDFMLSDSTGIPPRYARKAGMKQIPLGRFTQSFLDAPESHNRDFQELWAERPYRRLPFRFGYVDAEKQAHLLVTRPRAEQPAQAPAGDTAL